MSNQKRRNRRPGFSTRAIHSGYDPFANEGALSQPVYMTSTFAFESAEHGADLYGGAAEGYIYGRLHNPTQALLERRLADLEEGEAGLAAATGMGAISAALWSLCKAGDRIVADRCLYGNTHVLLTQGMARYGVEVEQIDMTDLDQLAVALKKPARIVYLESPANPKLHLVDIAAAADMAHRAGALLLIDNTFATPVLQRPLTLGADLVLHSATKYLGGHGDLLAGAVIGSAELVTLVRKNGLRYMTGAALSPWNVFLVLRGLKTLELRMARHGENALTAARFLEGHPAIARVIYPGLPDFPQADLARRQMALDGRGGGGLVAIELKGGLEAGRRFLNGLQMTLRAVSLGDPETLAQHPASMTHFAVPREDREAAGITDGLVRLSLGLENTDDILADLEAALAAVK
jgi:methionine-gamma-lyase